MPKNDEMTNSELYQKLIEANEKQTTDITSKIDHKIKDIQEKVGELESKVNLINKKVINNERMIRRNGVVVFGLEVDKSDFIKSTTQKLNTLLGTSITRADLNNIYLGNEKEPKPRINIEFTSYLKKQEIFGNIKKLKGSGVGIVNDLSYEERQSQKVLKDHLQNAKNQNLQAKIKGTRLEIEGVLYNIEDLKRLEEEGANNESSSEEETEDKEKLNKKKTKTNKRKSGQIIYSPPAERNLRSGIKK
ncbi:unnamed protein product [Psylliodes chrysocephalus]|uniref:Uncharacterized protein n=1 Tax=Psylliodes chrysocephalus TaxID=3402493 RepID=A0A9P0GCD1_9CUCU|nr:unnamed protein product [Psylliodes chrysocephala]